MLSAGDLDRGENRRGCRKVPHTDRQEVRQSMCIDPLNDDNVACFSACKPAVLLFFVLQRLADRRDVEIPFHVCWEPDGLHIPGDGQVVDEWQHIL